MYTTFLIHFSLNIGAIMRKDKLTQGDGAPSNCYSHLLTTFKHFLH